MQNIKRRLFGFKKKDLKIQIGEQSYIYIERHMRDGEALCMYDRQIQYSPHKRFDLNKSSEIVFRKPEYAFFRRKSTLGGRHNYCEDFYGVNLMMSFCPSGSFDMGRPKHEDNNDLYKDAPRHKVIINKPFLISQTHITKAFYFTFSLIKEWEEKKILSVSEKERRYTTQNIFASSTEDMKSPATTIKMKKILEFCNFLSKIHGYNIVYEPNELELDDGQKTTVYIRNNKADGYRLPTEAEWEYAARADSDFEYSGSNDPLEVAWFEENLGKFTERTPQRVELKKSNAWGLYDMSGNVYDLCEDTFFGDAYSYNQINGIRIDPHIFGMWGNDMMCVDDNYYKHRKTLRGGNCFSDRADLTVYARNSDSENYDTETAMGLQAIGFRVVRNLF